MAMMGTRYFRVAVVTSDDSDAAYPVYDAAKTYVVGRLASVNATPKSADAAIYGDDEAAETNHDVLGYDITTTLTEIDFDADMNMFGANKNSDSEIVYTKDDSAPNLGIGYILVLQVKAKKYFKAIYYPLTKAIAQAEGGSSKGKNVSFSAHGLNFDASPCRKGVTRVVKIFTKDTTNATDSAAYEAAKAWLKTKMPDPTPPSQED